MSFGGSPWQQRNVGSYQQGGPQSMYMQQQYGQMQSGNMYSSNSNSMISYPTGGSSGRMNSSSYSMGGGNGPSNQHFNSIGTVTKMSSDFGLVNEEVFFYRNVVKGTMPKLGDRVLFEAIYSSTGQYEWNATRIQLMSSQPVQPLMGSSSKADYPRGRMSPRRSPGRGVDFRRDERRERDRVRSREREDEQMRKRRRKDSARSRDRPGLPKKEQNIVERKERERLEREREQRERERDLRELRERERANKERADRSPYRGSAKGRRAPATRRYMVQIPRNVLTYKSADMYQLRQRYANLYIPSDFFYARMKWSETFTPDNPFSLRRPCQFHIKHPVVQPPFEKKPDDLEPSDADFLYSAKVMLLSLPTLVEMYQKCLENQDDEGSVQKLHPSRLISFLVGTRCNKEPLAIGGPWSPSLDGDNPEEDPAVLIRTAIRTCRALTGIDLSNCTQWYRFVEFHYHRNDYKNKSKSNKDKDDSPRVETVVIFLPDIHSCMPSTTEWERLRHVYQTNCEEHIARKNAAAKANAAKIAKETEEKGSPAAEGIEETTIKGNEASTSTANIEPDENKTASTDKANDRDDVRKDGAAPAKAEQPEPMAVDGDTTNEKGDNPEPTHYSKLDLKTMKLQQIREELSARGLPSKGAKTALVARLTKALDQEKEDEENDQQEAEEEEDMQEIGEKNENDEEQELQGGKQQHSDDLEDMKNENNTNDGGDIDMNDMVVVDEYDSNKQEEATKELDEREKGILQRRYAIPETPQIIVHPNKHAKGGKFDCTTLTLQSLLNYVPGDSKERCFEVYVFAELFNEMLMRDFGFNIYKEIYYTKESKSESNENSEKKSDNNEKEQNGAEEKAKEEHETDSKSSKDKQKEKDIKEKDKDKEEKKLVIVKPHLLLSFVYFDTTQCGSIFEKDLEELFGTLGLDLSRGQIRKTLSKLGPTKSLHYRKLTDREEALNAEPVIEDLDDIPQEELKDLALGNKIFGICDEEYWDNERTTTTTEEGMVNFNGTVVHIAKLMEQINRTEKNYTDMDKLYSDLLKQHNDLQKDYSKGQNKIKDLQSDVKSLSRKLGDANSEIFSLDRKYRAQQNTLQFIYNRVQPYFAPREKDTKSENTKDKETKKEDDKDKKKETKENGKDAKDKEIDSKDKEEKESKDDAADENNEKDEAPEDEKSNAEVHEKKDVSEKMNQSIKVEKAEKVEKVEKAEKIEKAEKPVSVKVEKKMPSNKKVSDAKRH